MSALLMFELRRALARRLTRVFAALLALIIALLAFLVVPGARERARIKTDADIEECVQGKSIRLPVGADTPGEIERFCDSNVPSRDPQWRLTDLHDIFSGAAGLLIILGWLLGASLVGAEWGTGSLATTLTWEGRRVRVAGLKILACVIVAFTGCLAWQVLTGVAVTPAALLAGSTSGADVTWLRGIGGTALRVATLSSIAAGAGAGIAIIVRNTAAALGTVFAYLFLLENNVLWSYFKGARQWLLLGNTLVFLDGHAQAGGDVPGRSVVEAGVLLVAYTALICVVAVALFRRRDVT